MHCFVSPYRRADHHAPPPGSSADSTSLLYLLVAHINITLSFRAGTRVQGFQKHELNNVWVSAQLWIITANEDGSYTIQNANSRTYLDLTGSTSFIIRLLPCVNSGYGYGVAGNIANGTPLIGYQGTGNPNQKWIIKRNSTNTAYVYVHIHPCLLSVRS